MNGNHSSEIPPTIFEQYAEVGRKVEKVIGPSAELMLSIVVKNPTLALPTGEPQKPAVFCFGNPASNPALQVILLGTAMIQLGQAILAQEEAQMQGRAAGKGFQA